MVVALYTTDETVEKDDGSRGYPRIGLFDGENGWIEGRDRFAQVGDDVSEAWLLDRYTPPGLTAVKYDAREHVAETIGDPPAGYTLDL